MREIQLDYDPISGIGCSLAFDNDGTMRVLNYQDDAAVKRIIDGNKRFKNTGAADKKRRDDFHHYATVPDIVWLKWKEEKGVDIFNQQHSKELFKLLNSPEYAYLRVSDKKHEG